MMLENYRMEFHIKIKENYTQYMKVSLGSEQVHIHFILLLLNFLLKLLGYYIFFNMGGTAESKPVSKPIEGTKEKGFSHIYRNAKFMDKLYDSPKPQYTSVRDILVENCLSQFKDHDFLGRITVTTKEENGETKDERTLTKWTYSQSFHMAEKIGSFMLQNKMEFKQNERGMNLVGIYSKNRYEWMVTDIACCLYGLTLVPLYQTLGIQNLSYCLNHSGITTLFCTAQTIKTIISLKDFGNLQNIVSYDPLPKQTQQKLQSLKFKVFYFNDALENTKQIVDYRKVKMDRENILTFSYTSGTTGPPKGAMLSHGNFLAFLAAFLNHDINGFKPDDVYLSFLPLPHIFQRVMIATILYSGSLVVFYNGDILKFKDDAVFVRPTVFVAVPRLFNRIYEGVQAKFNETTGIKKCLLENGLSSKTNSVQKSGEYKSGFYDSVVFSKVREGFGGRIRLMVTGSAPIKAQVYEFMKVIMGCPFYEGYGQTENTAAAFIQGTYETIPCQVGAVASNLEFKLNDIPEMQYTSDDVNEQGKPTPRGQIWLRGPAVFKGYYKNKQKTQEALSEDGWLRTGDVGMLLPGTNSMKIIDRKKNIFKLQQGQYVAAEKVEAVYSKCHLMSEVFLHGQSIHNFCVAVATVRKEQIQKLAASKNIKGSYEQIIKNAELRTLICKELDSVGKANGLMSFQQAKNIYIEPQPLFLTKGILSSTMKLQRFAAKKLYAKEIEDMYNEGPLNIK